MQSHEITDNELVSILENSIVNISDTVFLQNSPLVSYLSRHKDIIDFEFFNEKCKINKSTRIMYKNTNYYLQTIKKWLYRTRSIDVDIIDDIENLSTFFKVDKKYFLFSVINSIVKQLEQSEIYTLEVYLQIDNKIILIDNFQTDSIYPIVRTVNVANDNVGKIIFFIVSVPWRRVILEGNRGYRNSILEAGELTFFMKYILKDANIKYEMSLNFIDSKVNKQVGNDGVEKNVVACLEIIDND